MSFFNDLETKGVLDQWDALGPMNIKDLIKEKKLKDLTSSEIVYIKDFDSDYYGLIDYSG